MCACLFKDPQHIEQSAAGVYEQLANNFPHKESTQDMLEFAGKNSQHLCVCVLMRERGKEREREKE